LSFRGSHEFDEPGRVSLLAKNKKPQPEMTPVRFPRAAALLLARRWTVRRHDLMGRYRDPRFKLRAK
jgi:hypothetical protein